MSTPRIAALIGAATLTFALTGCGQGSTEAADQAGSSSDTTSSEIDGPAAETREADSLSITDPWVKSADSGMTAVFGTLVNDGAEDVVVTSASSDITSAMELHETVQNDDGSMAMQPKEDGFVVPAGGEHELAPGADHLMVMDLTRALQPGEQVTVTLTLEDGTTMEIDPTVKEFSGADEKYQNGDATMDMSGS